MCGYFLIAKLLRASAREPRFFFPVSSVVIGMG
jgi:hypothetical protein